jgi:hypothetical protein
MKKRFIIDVKERKWMFGKSLRVSMSGYAQEIYTEVDGEIVTLYTKGALKGMCMRFDPRVFKKFALWFLKKKGSLNEFDTGHRHPK